MPSSDVKARGREALVIGGGYSGLRFARAACGAGNGLSRSPAGQVGGAMRPLASAAGLAT